MTGAASIALLKVGDEAWCLLCEPAGKRSRSGDRHTLRGAARVRIEAIAGDAFDVVVLLASGGVRGERIALGRADLYATRGKEHRAFGALVSWFWGQAAARRGPPPRRPGLEDSGSRRELAPEDV